MNLGEKDLDALLKSWPAVDPRSQDEPDEERRWEARADRVVAAALAAKGEGVSGETLDALVAAPVLAAEPGEPGLGGGAPNVSGVVLMSGEKKMDEEKDPAVPVAKPSEAGTPAPERKRGSLKEIAARASQAGRSSAPGARPSVPSPAPSVPPSRASKPDEDAKPALRNTPVPTGAAPPNPRSGLLPRPVEAGKEDSGVINLDAVRAAATPQQVAAAEKAKPAQAGLFEDEQTVESAQIPGQKPAAAKVPAVAVVAAPKKSRTGPIAGALIAAVGLAAAFAIMQSKRPPPPQQRPAPVVAEAKPAGNVGDVGAHAPAPTGGPAPAATEAPTTQAATDPAPGATADTGSKPAEPARGAVATGPAVPGPAAPSKDAVADAKGAPPSGKSGDLQSEMERAVGGKVAPGGAADPGVPEPASARNQNIPEQPSQGSVQAAVGAVIGGAKACVAGADDISRATITFSSSGAVSSVSVSGWAAAHGKTGCVQAALKGAKVGAFSKPSYSVPVPIRP